MVIKEEVKEDVFAGFHLDNAVRDNEAELNREEEEEMYGASEFVDESVFADFHLDDIVKQNEEQRKQRLRLAEIEKGEELQQKEESQSVKGPHLRLLGSLFRKRRNKGDNGNGKDKDSEEEKEDPAGDEGKITTEPDGGGGAGGNNNRRQKNKNTKKTTSHSGTTVTTTIDEEDKEYNEGNNDDDRHQSDDDDDDYDFAQQQKSGGVTRSSSTGMAIGGMAVEGTAAGDAGAARPDNNIPLDDDQFRWISPHGSDSIFTDFDLDAIVKDYEKLQRKINFGTTAAGDNNNNNDDDDDDYYDDDNNVFEHNENKMDITVRYRSLRKFWLQNFPRFHGILFRVLIPLWIIVAFTMVLGNQLAHFEDKYEIAVNDEIMRGLYDLKTFPAEQTLKWMFGLPTLCFEYYLAQKVTPAMIADNKSNSNSNSTNNTSMLMLDWAGNKFPPISSEYSDDPSDTIDEIQLYMEICQDAGKEIITEFIDYTARQGSDGSENAMTFNWMRCWNTTLYGDVNPVFPSKAQLVAATEQVDFYAASWKLNQKELYNQFLNDGSYANDANCTTVECQRDAHDQSVAEATGSSMCGINKGASAWFWFVFMTTVGYGNQSPVTVEGRLLVGCLGWISIIAWAMILYVAGKVLGIVIDDLFRRCRCRSMTGDIQSVLVWGFIAGFWVVIVGEVYAHWSDYTIKPDTFEFNVFGLDAKESEELSTGDAYWFAYISLLTVGLGDFYLDSESFFYRDLILWTMCFLVGFTFLSTFLGQLADLMNQILPDSGDALQERLMNRKLVGKKEVQYKKKNEKGIEKLEKLVEIMDDDDVELVTQRVTRIRVKKNLLVHLLYQTKIELEYYKKRGEKYENLSYAKVCQEENMLTEVSYNTQTEREKLETYRDGRAHTSTEASLPAPGTNNLSKNNSYFDDGTPMDKVAGKLKLRSGKKSIKKNMSASTYL